MMDQGQHRLHQGARNDNDDNLAGGSYSFASQPQHDDYNSFFNNEATPSFNHPWDHPPIIDPRIQPNGFSQNPSTWHQNSLNTGSSHQTANYGLHSPNYGNAFAYPGYHPQRQQAYPPPAYDPALTYGNPTLLNGSGFDEHIPQEYERSSAPSQTISPSALQSFSPYSQFPTPSDDQNPQFRGDHQGSLRGHSGLNGFSQHLYDEQAAESTAALIPKGSLQGDFLARDPKELSTTMAAPKFTGFVFLGDNTFASDDSRAVIPKHSRRKSTKELRRQILAVQGNKPWSDLHKPLAKKLKLGHTRSHHPLAGGPLAAVGGQAVQSDSSSQSETDLGSEDDSEFVSDSDDLEVDEQSPLPATRPTDPRKVIEYDVVKCVWSKRNDRVAAAVIRLALGEYWNIVKQIRDSWKAETTAFEQAEQKKDEAGAEECRARIIKQRNMIEAVFRLTVQHGHPDIVEKLGEIPQLLLTFSQLIADRYKNGEYTGSLVTSIIQFLTRCITVDQSLLERTKLDKLLLKVAKRSDEKTKALAQKVLDNAEQCSKHKLADSKQAQTVDPSRAGGASNSSPQIRAPEAPALLKRPKETASAAVTGLKKPNGVGALKQTSAAPTKATNALSKGNQFVKAEVKALSTSSSNTVPLKVKVNYVVAKPSVFSSLQSASKRPGTSIAAQKAAQQTDGKSSKPFDSKATPSSVTAAALKPTFSFAETMANLTKPKEVPLVTKPVDSGPPETEDERKKRFRKEERRKLRVSFKSDDSLVEIRTFVHDPEEEMGHDDSMIRDVGDVGGEGRMLKMHKEREMLDDDEDVPAEEEELAPWGSLSAVDFSVVESDELARNCMTRGGKAEVKSSERIIQEQRELMTLMAFYTSLSDVPPSPREPADPYSGEQSAERSFGTPQDETKLREAQFYATLNPQSRLPNTSTAGGVQGADITALLQILNSRQPPAQPQPQPQLQQTQLYQPIQPVANGLEAIFAQFSGNKLAVPQSAAPQQAGLLDPVIQAALATINKNSQGQVNYAQPQPAQTQTPDLQTLLSQFTPYSSAPSQGYGYQTGYQNDADRKRQYEYEDQRQNEQYSDGKRVRGNNGKKYFGVPRVPCRFWQEGKCKKGDECTFLHD